MNTAWKKWAGGLGASGLLLLSACTEPTWQPAAESPKRLADVVVTDPDFDFATTQSVKVELQMAEGSAPQAIEAFDADGRRLMDGAFKSSASIDLRLPVGRANEVKLRVGSGDSAVERTLKVDANGRAGGDL